MVIVPLTSNIQHVSPSQAVLPKGSGGFTKNSKAVADHIKSVDKKQLSKKLGSLSPDDLNSVLNAIDNTFKVLPYPKGY